MKVKNRVALALAVSAFALSGCYIIPAAPNGQPAWPPGAVWGPGVATNPPSGAQPTRAPANAPATLPARLYPVNDIATQTGVITGTVVNMMTGKGRFQLNYRGETLTGEATRVDGDARRGVASAFSPSGAYMSCEYQMSNPKQGAGTFSMSNGAKYQAHIGI